LTSKITCFGNQSLPCELGDSGSEIWPLRINLTKEKGKDDGAVDVRLHRNRGIPSRAHFFFHVLTQHTALPSLFLYSLLQIQLHSFLSQIILLLVFYSSFLGGRVHQFRAQVGSVTFQLKLFLIFF